MTRRGRGNGPLMARQRADPVSGRVAVLLVSRSLYVGAAPGGACRSGRCRVSAGGWVWVICFWRWRAAFGEPDRRRLQVAEFELPKDNPNPHGKSAQLALDAFLPWLN